MVRSFQLYKCIYEGSFRIYIVLQLQLQRAYEWPILGVG